MSSPKLVSDFLNGDEFLSRAKSQHIHYGERGANDGGIDRVLVEDNNRNRKHARELWRHLVKSTTNLSANNAVAATDSIGLADVMCATAIVTTKDRKELPFVGIDARVVKALSSILILSNEDRSSQLWLSSHGGELDELPMDLLDMIEHCAPPSFHARVADFNDNLLYDMQDGYGLNHILIRNKMIQSRMKPNPEITLQNVVRSNKYLCSFLATETTVPQPPHVDFTWEQLKRDGRNLRLGFFPLTEEGMFLQVWSRDDDMEKTSIESQVIFIPFGKILTLPASTIHGGGFRTTGATSTGIKDDACAMHGNLRFHLYLAYNDVTLSKNETTNKYTEPKDKRKELADRYVNAPIVKDLMEFFFV